MDIQQVAFVKGVARWEQLPTDGRPEVALVGRSNVGKSALLNRLAGRRALARTSGTPGKTQQLNFFLVDDAFYLVDVPGLGYAKVSQAERARWAQLLERYLTEREALRAVVHLVDSRHPPTALDRALMAQMRARRARYLVALTKADKLSGNARVRSRAEAEAALAAAGLEVPVVLTSATDGRGRDELLDWLAVLLA